VWWGIVCVLLVVLWVRSYWSTDFINFGQRRTVASQDGIIRTLKVYLSGDQPKQFIITLDSRMGYFGQSDKYELLGLGYSPDRRWPQITVPYWFPVIVFGFVAAIPWLPWKFSLRTLLIATALFAVVLGVMVWSIR
jgi:hypothetical protein